MSHENPMLQRSQRLLLMNAERGALVLQFVDHGCAGSMGVVSLRVDEKEKKQSRPTGVDRRPFVQEVGYALD